MRIGLLGTGPWAERVHGPGLAAHPEVELTGVWGRRPEAAEALATTLRTRAYNDPGALIADVDAVSIALPPSVQAGLAARAAEAGRHLLLDKPVATTTVEARQVVDAVGRSGVSSVVFFTLRFDPATADWLESQSARGGWFTGRAEWLGSVFAEPAPGAVPSPFAASPWRRDKGALWDIAPHALSILLPALGDVRDLDSVAAARGPADTVHLVFRHEGGASSTATVSLTAPAAAEGVTAELRGEHGTTTLPGGRVGPVTAFQRAVDALLSSVATGRPHACDVRFGLRVSEILAAAERALGQG
ncbi:Gfo/Idh/MocA family protein [Streptomyces sp. TP-A0874]|uniref:Gfo/Idh/MocA family protein n=1 Tax=Streptomyces sp. TP-A0874 TaxID=549819 RepID=UPI00085360CA|nr:Gfo/Idh/MocA family oxidoreductase [Streptomyces sp. TP-A0874]